jgi:hypothetical protein
MCLYIWFIIKVDVDALSSSKITQVVQITVVAKTYK